MPRIFTLTISVLLLASACAGPSPEVPVGPAGVVDPVLQVGRDVYSSNCRRCHGSAGEGGAGPRLNGQDFDEDFPRLDDLISVISRGRKRMPSFSSSLSEASIIAVARYVRDVL